MTVGIGRTLKWTLAAAAAAYAASVYLEGARESELQNVDGKGKLGLVTGGASGVGLATVLLMARKGWVVYAVDVNRGALDELEKLAEAEALQVRCVACDITSAEKRAELHRQVAAEPLAATSGLDCLVNCAGIAITAPVLGMSDKQYELMIGVNTMAPVYLCKLFLELLLRGTSGGNIVNVSSISGVVGWPYQGLYAGTKFALEGITESLRREALASGLNLRVANINPGPIQTPLVKNQQAESLAWVEKNPSHPFSAGMSSMNAARERIPPETVVPLIFVQPEDVARAIYAAGVDRDPASRRFILKPIFVLLFALLRYLPVKMSDRLSTCL